MPLITKSTLRNVEEVVGFKCNKCKVTFNYDTQYAEVIEMVHINFEGGYGSVWGDGNKVDIVLCQRCGHELLKDVADITVD